MPIFSLFLCIYIVNFNILFVFSLTPYLRENLDFTSLEVGLFVSMFSATAFLVNLLIGPIVNKVGYKKSIVISSFICSIVFFLHALFESSEVLIFLRFLLGLVMPAIGVSILPYINNFYNKEVAVKKTGQVMAASSLAQITSLPVGALIGVYMQWSTPFYVMSILLMASFITAMFFLEDGGRGNKRSAKYYYKGYVDILLVRNNIKIILSCFLVLCSVFLLVTIFPTWFAQSFGKEGYETSLVLLLSGIAAMVGSSYSSQIGRIINEKKPMLGLATFLTIIYIPIYILFDSFGVIICSFIYIVYSLFRQSLMPHLTVFFFQMGDKEQKTHISAIFNALSQISISASALVSSVTYSYSGIGLLIIISIIMSFFSILIIRK